jgi:hypothetical protein
MGGSFWPEGQRCYLLRIRHRSPKAVVLVTVQGYPLDTFLDHSEACLELQGWGFHHTGRMREVIHSCARPFREAAICVMLAAMGNKDKGRKEAKKAPKPKPKPEPGRKHEVFAPQPPK